MLFSAAFSCLCFFFFLRHVLAFFKCFCKWKNCTGFLAGAPSIQRVAARCQGYAMCGCLGDGGAALAPAPAAGATEGRQCSRSSSARLQEGARSWAAMETGSPRASHVPAESFCRSRGVGAAGRQGGTRRQTDWQGCEGSGPVQVSASWALPVSVVSIEIRSTTGCFYPNWGSEQKPSWKAYWKAVVRARRLHRSNPLKQKGCGTSSATCHAGINLQGSRALSQITSQKYTRQFCSVH